MHPVSHIPSCRGFCCTYSLFIMSLIFRHAVFFAVQIHCTSCLSYSVMPWSLLYLFTAHHASHIPSCRGFCCNYSVYIMSLISRHAVVFAVLIHCASCLRFRHAVGFAVFIHCTSYLSYSVMRRLSDSVMRWSLLY